METTFDDLIRALDSFVEACRTRDPHSNVTGDVLASFGGLVLAALRQIDNWQLATDSQLSQHFHQQAQDAYLAPLPDIDPPDKRARAKEIEQEVRDRMHPIPMLQRIVYPWLQNDTVYRADVSNEENLLRKRAAAEKVAEALRILDEGQ